MPAENLLMFSIDDMRAVKNWGHFTPIVSTPNLDRLAAMGTTFDRAVTQVPLCNPSRTSVFTGQQPSRTGILENEVPWFDRVDPASTLPAVLKAAGMHVAMYGKHFHDDAIPLAARAVMFDEFFANFAQGSPANVIDDGLRHDLPYRSGRYGGSPSDLMDEQSADRAVRFLEAAGDLDKPFFLGVGIFKPHLDWYTPPAFFNRYDTSEIRAALELSLSDGTIIPGNGEYFDVPPMSLPSREHPAIAADIDKWVDYIHAYLAATSYADAKIGEVLDALEADPALAADTAILLWSDHGYHLGDKDRWEKFTHWRESTQVPFILVDPDAPGGQTARQVVSLVDIFPTVLDLLGIDAPAALGLQGESLLPIVNDIDIGWYDAATGRGVALTTIYGSVSIRAVLPGGRDVRYTRYPDGTEELYNLTRDPNEHVNRLDLATGAGLTAADDALHRRMSALMDDKLADAGILLSDGVTAVRGTAADELLSSTNAPGTNHLVGGDGDDTYVLYQNATIVEAAEGGFDVVVINNFNLEKTYQLAANVEVVRVQVGFTGNAADNVIIGAFQGGVFNGGAGADTIDGGGGNDTINGGSGEDSLVGEVGNDVMRGGAGRDTLVGGRGLDVFDYDRTSVSTAAASDVVADFAGAGITPGDRFDLSGIDADPSLAGNQTFRFGLATAGGVRIVEAGGNSVLLAYTDADPEPELRVVIRDGAVPATTYTVDDVIL
jgi:arylsulfatase A-like enzyme